MTLFGKTPYKDHARRHQVGGSDEIPFEVRMRPPHQQGSVMLPMRAYEGNGRSSGVMTAPLVLPDRTYEGVPWESGEIIGIEWQHVDWGFLHRQARIHLITGGELDTSVYFVDTPWRGSPYASGISTAGSSLPSDTYSGLYCLQAVNANGGDSFSWTGSGGLTLSESETFSFDFDEGGGFEAHYGYTFVNISGTGVISISSSSSTGRVFGYTRISVASGSPDFSTIVAEELTETGSKAEKLVTLTDDIPAGSQIVPVVFFQVPQGQATQYSGAGGAMEWPLVKNYTREVLIEKVPMYQADVASKGKNFFPLWRHIGGAGQIQVGSGGSPSGSAGGALDGSYPNPGLASSVAGSGLSESSDVLAVNVDNSTIEINSDTLRVKDGGITTAKLSFDPATQTELDAHINDTSDAHDASAISVADSGNFYTGTDVEAVLQELGGAFSASGYATVEDEGGALTQRTTMNFVGGGVTAADSGGKTVVTIPGSGASSELDYVETTSPLTITATSDATAQSFITGTSQSYSGARIRIEVFAPYLSSGSGQSALFNLFDGSTDLGRIAENFGASDSAVMVVRYLTPSAGSHQYIVKAWKTGGTASAGAGAGGTATYLPAYLRISEA